MKQKDTMEIIEFVKDYLGIELSPHQVSWLRTMSKTKGTLILRSNKEKMWIEVKDSET